MKPFIMQFLLASHCSLSLSSKLSLLFQNPILKYPQLMPFRICETHPYKSEDKITDLYILVSMFLGRREESIGLHT
jgi:hypothetical protein